MFQGIPDQSEFIQFICYFGAGARLGVEKYKEYHICHAEIDDT
jgi:hypothetical protein